MKRSLSQSEAVAKIRQNARTWKVGVFQIGIEERRCVLENTRNCVGGSLSTAWHREAGELDLANMGRLLTFRADVKMKIGPSADGIARSSSGGQG